MCDDASRVKHLLDVHRSIFADLTLAKFFGNLIDFIHVSERSKGSEAQQASSFPGNIKPSVLLVTAKEFVGTWRHSLQAMATTVRGAFPNFSFSAEILSHVLAKFTTKYALFEDIGKRVVRTAMVLQQTKQETPDELVEENNQNEMDLRESDREQPTAKKSEKLQGSINAALEVSKILVPLSTVTYELKKFSAKNSL
jgi:hypothetical protein